MEMNPMQAIVNQMNADRQKERSTSQMTLGEMIAALVDLAPDRSVAGVTADAMSYRGYYSDIAFEPGNTTVGALLAECRDAMGAVFEGYKGGDYLMGAPTPLWVSPYRMASGTKIVGINSDGDPVTIETEQEKW